MKILISACFFVILLVLPDAKATIINVPGNYPTIQSAIDAAQTGDTVLVQPGTYLENIDYSGKNIVVASLFLTTNDTSYISQTIIDGGGKRSVVRFLNNETSAAKLTGFTITNGIGDSLYINTYWYRYGGGIRCHMSASPTLSYLRIINNTATEGGGIFIGWWNVVTSADVHISNCEISNNYARWFGGGIFCDRASVQVDHCKISNNGDINNGGYGGGLAIYEGTNTINITNSEFSNNLSKDEGGAIYSYHYFSTPSNMFLKIDSTNFIENGTDWAGGAISVDFIHFEITNSTFIRNFNMQDVYYAWSQAGGAINANCYDDDPNAITYTGSLENVVFQGNHSGTYGGGIHNCSYNLFGSNLQFLDNTALKGGAISNIFKSTKFDDILIKGNSAIEGGGGTLVLSGDIFLSNATMANNHAPLGSGHMGWGGRLRLTNSIMWSTDLNQVYFDNSGPGNTIVVAYSDVKGGQAGITGSGLFAHTINWLSGNIETYPQFVDTTNNNFNLQQGSPCIDAGIAFFTYQGDTLVNIDTSKFYGLAPDMGCYESPYTTDINSTDYVSMDYMLYQNYPNPFNPSTRISWQSPVSSWQTLKVYDVLGNEIATLVDEYKQAGTYEINFDASALNSGVYFFKLEAGNFSAVKKMTILK